MPKIRTSFLSHLVGEGTSPLHPKQIIERNCRTFFMVIIMPHPD